MKAILPNVLIVMVMVAAPCAADDLTEYRQRSNSDDAKTIEEALFHGSARALIIRNVEPNKLGIGGAEFRVKRNPVGKGCFVYDPRNKFSGVKRTLIWWVPEEDKAFILNGPSKVVTPSLKWARDYGPTAPPTGEVVAYIFDNKPMTPSKSASKPSKSKADSFTMKEYRIYRSIIDTPMSVPDSQVYENVARKFSVSAAEAKIISKKVMMLLSKYNWFGSPESEIAHATDWKGQTP